MKLREDLLYTLRNVRRVIGRRARPDSSAPLRSSLAVSLRAHDPKFRNFSTPFNIQFDGPLRGSFVRLFIYRCDGISRGYDEKTSCISGAGRFHLNRRSFYVDRWLRREIHHRLSSCSCASFSPFPPRCSLSMSTHSLQNQTKAVI